MGLKFNNDDMYVDDEYEYEYEYESDDQEIPEELFEDEDEEYVAKTSTEETEEIQQEFDLDNYNSEFDYELTEE